MLAFLFIFSISSKRCQDCKSLAKVLENFVNNNIPKDKYGQLIIENCNKLPKVLQPKCISFAKEKADSIISLIKQGVPYNQTCVNLKFCNSVNEDDDVLPEAESGEWAEKKPNWAVSWDEDF